MPSDLPASHHRLKSRLEDRIRDEGPISFADFMAVALYAPEDGYYSGGRGQPGREGDFYTSVSVGPCFGQLLADYVLEKWTEAGKPETFPVIEGGGARGQLARDILAELEQLDPNAARAVDYHLIDPAPLDTPGPFQRHSDWESLSPFDGPALVLANELLDAFPVHSCIRTTQGWRERCVGLADDPETFCWVETEPDPALIPHLPDPDPLPEGYRTEINLAALSWIDRISQLVPRGHLLLFDYGFPGEEFFGPWRTAGHLQGYYQQQKTADPLDLVGLQDLTAHINFSGIEGRATEKGWIRETFTDQHRFLIGLSRNRLLAMEKAGLASTNPDAHAQWLRQFRQLTHPELMGSAFRVLEMSRAPISNPN